MPVIRCLNCDNIVELNYCPSCGQKASTHRFSWIHFLQHDLAHALFHVDKGIFYTIKELIIRPGHSVREYIQGKRAKHFNIFTFIFLVLLIRHYLGKLAIPTAIKAKPENQLLGFVDLVTDEYYKIAILFLVPGIALATFISFRKAKFNFTEHMVAASFFIAGYAFLAISADILAFVYKSTAKILTYLLLLYSFYYYIQFFSLYYKPVGILQRTVLAYLLLFVLLFLIVAAVQVFLGAAMFA